MHAHSSLSQFFQAEQKIPTSTSHAFLRLLWFFRKFKPGSQFSFLHSYSQVILQVILIPGFEERGGELVDWLRKESIDMYIVVSHCVVNWAGSYQRVEHACPKPSTVFKFSAKTNFFLFNSFVGTRTIVPLQVSFFSYMQESTAGSRALLIWRRLSWSAPRSCVRAVGLRSFTGVATFLT